jgi:plasmid stabilization system protein ParE
LKQIHEYIAKDSKYYARNVSRDIAEKTEQLDKFSEIGRPNIRGLIIYSYQRIYEVLPDEIEILAIIPSRRDFSSLNVDEGTHE